MYSMTAPAELGEEDVNLYAVIDNARIPEAFPPFYKGSLTEDGGCKGLQVQHWLHLSQLYSKYTCRCSTDAATVP